MLLSVIVAVVLMIGAGAALTLLRPSGDDSIAHLYALLVVLELALGFPVRVIHSGIYATRRIYRPRWLMLAPTFVQLGILTAGLYWYPTAAIIIAIVAFNAIGIWGTVHFTLEVYRLTGLWPKLGHPGTHSGGCCPRSRPGLVCRQRCRDLCCAWTRSSCLPLSACMGQARDRLISPPV
ncbi:hypothetical protein I551_4354 [Mycobacterium ulcerans str. Harvey]|uniref:Uncharacterized protein n=1 Tax=Mycobacterium ulcerans str. Harvey TaxID=1299332 RepID=A0ABN0QWQ7_MYCUL|nr:hypothetical protein I551_4354 [Mycobacterium ulcerans str. Harvey]